jgi:hypothetical protein
MIPRSTKSTAFTEAGRQVLGLWSAISAKNAWRQPLLGLVDTMVGVTVAVS